MQVKCEFIFNSIEEMHDFTSKMVGASSGDAQVVSESKALEAKKAAPKKAAAKAATPAEIAVDVQPEVVNPFAGMNQAATPVKEEPAQVNRQGIIMVATDFINSRKDAGLPIAKIAEIMNTQYFIPRGIAQCKVGELNDFQLADFHTELQKSIMPAADRELANMKAGASLV